MSGRRHPSAAATEATEHALTAHDGVQLFVRRWRPCQRGSRAVVVVVHGYQEHGGRYRELATRLLASDIETVAADLRGHGRSGGPRGHVAHFADYERDVGAVVAAEAARGVPVFVLGHSLGGLIALCCAGKGQLAGIAGLLVTNPYLALAMAVPAPKLWLGQLLARIYPNFGMGNGIDLRWLSHDADAMARYRRDPLRIDRATAGWLVASQRAQAWLQPPPRLSMPLFFAHSDADPIASSSTNAGFAGAVQAPHKTIVVRTGELHELLQEKDRLSLMDAMAGWMLQRLAAR